MLESFKLIDSPSWFDYAVLMVFITVVMLLLSFLSSYLITKLFVRLSRMFLDMNSSWSIPVYERNRKIKDFFVKNLYAVFVLVWGITIVSNFISVSDAFEAYKPENQAKENIVIYKNSDKSYTVYNKASDKPIRVYTEKLNEKNSGHETLEYIDIKPNSIMNINNIDQTKEVHDRIDIEKNTTDFHTPDDKFDGVLIVHKILFNEKIECDCDPHQYNLDEDNSWYVWNHSDKPVVFHIPYRSLRSEDFRNVAPHRHLNQIDMDNDYKKEH